MAPTVAILKSVLIFSRIQRPTDSKFNRKCWRDLLIRNALIHFDEKSKMVALAACILNHFSWTKRAIYSNFIGSIEVTCRSKVAKILLTGSPKWPPSWKSILNFFSWTDRPNDLDLFGNEVSDTRPSWSSCLPYMDKAAILFNGPATFGQIINIPSKKTFTCYTNVYRCIVQGQGRLRLGTKVWF